MSKHEDIELTKLCAEAMGYESLDVGYTDGEDETPRQRELDASQWMHRHGLWSVGEYWINEAAGSWITRSDYDPLHNDAQAMALVKRFKLDVWWPFSGQTWRCSDGTTTRPTEHEDLNRAICLCVAQMHRRSA